MNESVIAITVTYNRSATLEKTLKNLLNQSYKNLEKIIIVDNGSMSEHVEKIKEFEKYSEKIKVLYLDSNLGGAGGFFKGMEYVLNRYNPDWYWIMDDDAYPRRECLEILIDYKNYSSNIGCLAPAIYGIDRNTYQMYHHKKISSLKVKEMTVNDKYESLSDVTKIDANAFVGPLFSKKAIERMGLPDSELFIYGDDTEYTYRISREFDILLIKSAIIDHQDILANGNELKPQAWWKEYYMYRNRFLFVNKFETNLVKRFFSNIIIIKRILKKIIVSIIKSDYKRVRCYILLKSLCDGIRNKKGKTIDPNIYVKFIDSIRS